MSICPSFKNYIFTLLLIVVISSCSEVANQAEQPTVERKDTVVQEESITTEQDTIPVRLSNFHLVDSTTSYTSTRASIKKERQQLLAQKLSSDSLSIIFKTALLNKIIPYWEGTPWAFEGHISQPHTGEIACGYFVSTTLQHIGLNLNRYHLAQQSPINEAKTLAIDTSAVQTFSEASSLANIVAIQNYLKEGIHFIGFDQSHVGYILKEKNQLYIIHSNYMDNIGVQIEPIQQSAVFQSYDIFHIVPLSTNEALLDYWVKGLEVKVVRS